MKNYNIRLRTHQEDGSYEDKDTPLEEFIAKKIEGPGIYHMGKIGELEEEVERLTTIVKQLLLMQYQTKAISKKQLLEVIGVYPEDNEEYEITKK